MFYIIILKKKVHTKRSFGLSFDLFAFDIQESLRELCEHDKRLVGEALVSKADQRGRENLSQRERSNRSRFGWRRWQNVPTRSSKAHHARLSATR